MTEKPSQSLTNLEAALARLAEALQEPTENKLAIDGAIQRFEFVIELYWKTLKRLLAWQGIQTQTPREALQHLCHTFNSKPYSWPQESGTISLVGRSSQRPLHQSA